MYPKAHLKIIRLITIESNLGCVDLNTVNFDTGPECSTGWPHRFAKTCTIDTLDIAGV
jgi:hypothetical protein